MMNYTHGGDIYSFDEKSVIDFSSNINPLGLSKNVKKVFEFPEKLCTVYPDPFCRRLIDRIATFEKVNKKYILCGNGAADLIYRAAFVLKIKKALVLAPTFSEYEKAVTQFGGSVEHYILKEENGFNIDEDFISTIEKTCVDTVFICNPNNPTGQTSEKKFLTNLAQFCKKRKIRLIIDECFLNFVPDSEKYSMISDLERFPNMIILKAFTKFFALPGLRLGYLLCSDESLLEKVYDFGQPWSVSAVAQECGAAAIEDKDYIRKTVIEVNDLKTCLLKELKKLPLRVFNSQADYILFYSEMTDLHSKLLKYNILIRDCSNYKGLKKGYYRVAVKSKENNKKLIDALNEVLCAFGEK